MPEQNRRSKAPGEGGGNRADARLVREVRELPDTVPEVRRSKTPSGGVRLRGGDAKLEDEVRRELAMRPSLSTMHDVRISLRSPAPASTRTPSVRNSGDEVGRLSVGARRAWRRVEVSLAIAAAAGIVSVVCVAWLLGLGFGEVARLVEHTEGARTRDAVEWLARLGLLGTEALLALAVSTCAGLLLLRCEIRPSTRESVPFYARIAALVRIVAIVVVYATNARTWFHVFEASSATTVPLLGAVQLVALLIASIHPPPSYAPSPSLPSPSIPDAPGSTKSH